MKRQNNETDIPQPRGSATTKAHETPPITKRGRPPVNPPVNPATKAAFTAALKRSRFSSLRQWAKAAGVPYQTMVQYTQGAAVPSLERALALSRTAGTTVEALFSHLDKGE